MVQSNIVRIMVLLLVFLGSPFSASALDKNGTDAEKRQSGSEMEGPPSRDEKRNPSSTASPKLSIKSPAPLTKPENENNTDGSDADKSPGRNGESADTDALGNAGDNLVAEGSGDSANGPDDPRMEEKTGDETPAVSHADAKPAALGKLRVETEPEGARVTIAVAGTDVSEPAGDAPMEVRLPANLYRVTLEKEGYETAVAEVKVEEGRTAWLRLRMEPARSGAQRGIRIVGHLLFWPGLATSATGIALLVADNPEENVETGKIGFAVAGAGVAMTVLGGIFLGITYRDQSVYTIPPVAIAPTPRLDGVALSFQKSF